MVRLRSVRILLLLLLVKGVSHLIILHHFVKKVILYWSRFVIIILCRLSRLILVFFSQSFQPLHPPQWDAHKVETLPAGPEDRVLMQMSETTPWLTLSEWDGQKGERVSIFLPENLSPEAESCLLER